MNKLIYIDLFAGCGGLSLGLSNSGWKGLFAVERSKDAFATLKHNLLDKDKHFDWPSWLPVEEHDINEIIEKHEHELDKLRKKISLVAGGPPCQGFSIAGKRREDDERNKLIDSYLEFIKIIKPKLIIFENVQGFTAGFKNENSRGKAYSTYVWEKLEALNYDVDGNILDFSNYGIPQRRKRFILVGVLNGDAKSFFKKLDENRLSFLKEKGLELTVSLEDAISDLLRSHGFDNCPDSKGFNSGKYSNVKSRYQELMRNGSFQKGVIADSHRFPNHHKDTEEKFAYIINHAPKGKNASMLIKEKYSTNKNWVVPLDKDVPSPTLTTLPDDYIHYCEPRILTVREYARIQSFPDWFEFRRQYTTGNKARHKDVPRYTQVGNAVPPLFAEQCGLVLKEIIKND
jgi:DNA (cytosine-5)-methyltransferase 1